MKCAPSLLALALGLALSHGAAQTVPSNATLAGTVITNQGIVTGTAADGSPLNVPTEQVEIVVSLVPSILISPDGDPASPGQTVTAAPNTATTLTYTVTNTGNGTQTAQLTLSHSENQPGTLYLDNGNGTLDAADTNLGVGNGSFTFPAGTQATIFVSTSATGPDPAYVNLSATTSEGAPVDSNNTGRITVNASTDLTWVRVSPATQIVGSPGVATVYARLTSDAPAVLTSDLQLSAAVPAGTTATYVVSDENGGQMGAAAPTIQEALDNYLTVGPGLSQTTPLLVQATLTVPAGLNDRDSLTTSFSAWVDPQTVITSPDTAATPETVTSTLLVARGVGNVKKQQNVCAQSGASFTCGIFTPDPATVKPCDLIYYRVSGYNSGLGSLNTVTVNDTLSSGLWLHWAAAQGFDMTELDSSDFPISSDTDASVRANTATAEGSWASEQTYPALSDMTVQAATLSGGTPSALSPGRGLYMMVAAQVPGNGCAAPQRGVNITNEPQMLPTAQR